MIPIDVIRETLTCINSRHEGSEVAGLVIDSHSGNGLVTVTDLAGSRRLPFSVTDGVVRFRGVSYRPTIF